MARYRKAWRSAVVLLGIIGAWAAFDALSVSGVLTLLLLALCLGGCFAVVPVNEGEPRPWRRAMTLGAVSGAAVVAAAGLIALWGAGGAALVVVTVMTSPPVLARTVAWCGGRRQATNPGSANPSAKPRTSLAREVRDAPRRGAPSGSAEPTFLHEPWMAVEPTSMDDAGLCLAWRKTYVALQHASALAWKLHVVRRRQELLDELERRNARGFSAWLSAGARAAGDPSRYITTATGTAPHPYDR